MIVVGGAPYTAHAHNKEMHAYMILHTLGGCNGLLYPRESECRDVRLLDGLWNFRADYSPDRRAGFVEEWCKAGMEATQALLKILYIV